MIVCCSNPLKMQHGITAPCVLIFWMGHACRLRAAMETPQAAAQQLMTLQQGMASGSSKHSSADLAQPRKCLINRCLAAFVGT